MSKEHIFISHSSKDDGLVKALRDSLEILKLETWVDSQLVKGAEEEKLAEANEAATLLLSLPWELLHDGRSFLFHGARPVRVLGRLEEAAAAYEAGIKTDEKRESVRDVAVGKAQLGTVRKNQGRYDDAINAYEKARVMFENLGEPASVAVIWHQTGMVYQKAGRVEAAEQAYRRALAIRVQQNLTADEATTLTQPGQLYDEMDRLEEAVIFFQNAVEKDIEINNMDSEGRDRNNLAFLLIKLNRYGEARQEIKRAIECKKPYGHAAKPWTSWDILYDLEQAEGNVEAANKARDEAIRLFLSYRRDGGENHDPDGRLCAWFRKALQEQKPDFEIRNKFK
jgi:tetratricopeptide (TPR) repeat protein